VNPVRLAARRRWHHWLRRHGVVPAYGYYWSQWRAARGRFRG
jgi:hypothetical protein